MEIKNKKSEDRDLEKLEDVKNPKALRPKAGL